MGCQEVIDFFEKHPEEEFSTKDLADTIGAGILAVGRAVSKLLDTEDNILKRELSLNEKKERYGKVVPAKIFVYMYK